MVLNNSELMTMYLSAKILAVDCSENKSANPSVTGSIPVREIFLMHVFTLNGMKEHHFITKPYKQVCNRGLSS